MSTFDTFYSYTLTIILVVQFLHSHILTGSTPKTVIKTWTGFLNVQYNLLRITHISFRTWFGSRRANRNLCFPRKKMSHMTEKHIKHLKCHKTAGYIYVLLVKIIYSAIWPTLCIFISIHIFHIFTETGFHITSFYLE